VYSRLLSACNQFLFGLRLRPGEVLQSVSIPAALAKGETPVQAIGKLRVEMLSISQELAKVRAAPLPVADQLKCIDEFINRRSLVGMPKISIVRDQLQAPWPDDIVTSKSDVFALLCALFPKSMSDALKREIEAQPAPANAMPSADRIAKINSLEAKLLEHERKESALLDDTILPRAEMSPLAYLQISVVAQEAAAA
jgi:hypothetical protein